MTKLVWAFLSILAGALMGLGLTAMSVENSPGFALVKSGAWVARPRVGSVDADPYSKAFLATRGEVPMGAAEGLMITATRDDMGDLLDIRCTYRLSGPVPSARYWTLAVHDSRERGPSESALRTSYTSAEVLRLSNTPVSIMISAEPQPGNWIPLPAMQPKSSYHSFEVALRLYDAQVSTNAYALDAATVPKIIRETCR